MRMMLRVKETTGIKQYYAFESLLKEANCKTFTIAIKYVRNVFTHNLKYCCLKYFLRYLPFPIKYH